MICLIPTTTELLTKGLIDIHLKQIWKLHGIPKKITSDRGPQFTSELMKELCTWLGIQQNLSTAYHPQTDGQVKCMHQETETFLCHYINYLQDDWEDWLAIAEYQYKIHSSTRHTLFYLNYGHHPWKGKPNSHPGSNDNVTNFLKLLDCACKDASASANIAAETAKQHYDLWKKPTHKYKPGDQVWLEASNLKSVCPSKKLGPKRYGPFKVVEKIGHAAYQLLLPDNWKLIYLVFNQDMLTPFNKASYTTQHKPWLPPPEIIGNELEYEVQQILDAHKHWNTVEFLVSWKGYGSEHNQCIKKRNVHTKDLVAAFYRCYPLPFYQLLTDSQKWFALSQRLQSYRQKDWLIYT